MSALTRRQLFKISLAAAGLTILPPWLPAGARASGPTVYAVTVRRFRRLRQLLQPLASTPWGPAVDDVLRLPRFERPTLRAVPLRGTRRSLPHFRTAAKRLAQLTTLYQEMLGRQPSPLETTVMLRALSERSRPRRFAQATGGGWATAEAQNFQDPEFNAALFFAHQQQAFEAQQALEAAQQEAFAAELMQIAQAQQQADLEAITIIAPAPTPEQQAQMEALFTQGTPLTNIMVSTPPGPVVPESPALVQTPVVYLEHPEAAFFGGEDAAIIQDQLQQRGLELAQAYTALVALRAAINLIKAGGPLIATAVNNGPPVDAFKFIASGLLGGEIAITVAQMAGITVVGFVGAGLIALGLVSAYVLIKNVYPQVNQPVTLFGVPLFDYEIQLEELPSASAPEAAVAPEPPPPPQDPIAYLQDPYTGTLTPIYSEEEYQAFMNTYYNYGSASFAGGGT